MTISGIIADIIQIINRKHSDLQNLDVDDHEQYVDVAGTRPVKKIISGLDEAKSETPAVGDIYLATDVGKLYVCMIAENWVIAKSDVRILLTTQGDILIRGETGLEKLGFGTSGKFLITKGEGVNPEWSNVLPAQSVGSDQFIGKKTVVGGVTTQDSGASEVAMYFDLFPMCGIRKDYSASPIGIRKIGFYLKKVGTPTGTVTFKVLRVADDFVLVEQLWGNAVDLPTEFTLEEVTLPVPYYANEDVRIVVAITGGTAGNTITVKTAATDIYADEQQALFETEWLSRPTFDTDSKITEADQVTLLE